MAFCNAAINRAARSSSSFFSRTLGSALCSEDASPFRSFSSSLRKRAKSSARPELPACGRVPRKSASSSVSIASRHSRSAPPRRQNGCFRSASSVGGSSPLATACAASRAKTPAGVSISASPPESSKSRSQRASAAITRRASARSGVTSAADLSRCRASRIAIAIASASISGLGASMTARSCMPFEILSAMSGCFSLSCHCAVAVEGRIASDTSTSRPYLAGGQRISTSLRLIPKRCNSACMANWGWFDVGSVVNLPFASLMPPMPCQALSSRSVSSPGSTTAPWGSAATAWRNFAVAGIEPVEPAAITGPS